MQNHAEQLADRLVVPMLGLATVMATVTGDVNRFRAASLTLRTISVPNFPRMVCFVAKSPCARGVVAYQQAA